MFDAVDPDLVILDIKMNDNGMDGMEALRQIRLKDNAIPVILYSAYPDFKANIESWAATDYVVKSVDISELLEKINRYLSLTWM